MAFAKAPSQQSNNRNPNGRNDWGSATLHVERPMTNANAPNLQHQSCQSSVYAALFAAILESIETTKGSFSEAIGLRVYYRAEYSKSDVLINILAT